MIDYQQDSAQHNVGNPGSDSRHNECLSNDFVLRTNGRKVQLLQRDIDDWTITFVDTGQTANIGQRFKAVEKYLEGEEMFLANYTDVLTDVNLPDLVEFARARSVADRLARGEPIPYVESAARTFDPAALTVGFARRVASYKRLHLLVADGRRALALLNGPTPIQVVIAGKAHPQDDGAKRMVQAIFALKLQQSAGARVVFLEDHELAAARKLVAGCDVWLNLPRPPMEASGTSGMKAAVNGGLNLIVLDGWWDEAFDGANGWGIRSQPGPEEAAQDARDADALYGLLEREVVPLFHDRDRNGLPRRWLERVRASLRSLGPAFNTARTLGDYALRIYRPA